MSKRSTQKDTKARNTGQGALGMGGQPDDDTRDLEGGGIGGGSAGTETVGPSGDRGITGDIDAATRAARDREKGRSGRP